MFCNFQKISTGFSWSSADQGEAARNNADKDKIKKLDTNLKSSPENQHPNNSFTLSSVSASNLETAMPVGSQGSQNPTQGQNYDGTRIKTE